MPRMIVAPLSHEVVQTLSCGEEVLLSGTIYTARDAAHKRMVEALHGGEPLPFSIQDSVIYYAGPSPAWGERPIGSCGPTTSYRMDAYAPELIALGETGMIGKGLRGPAVVDAMKRWGAVYFAAVGGAGALISDCILSAEVIAYEDLGAEAVRRLTVKDMPLIVAIDARGNNLYERGKEAYFRSLNPEK